MKCIIRKRASNDEQKELRRQQILAATRARFEEVSFDEVNLNQIAADVGITKAALYRYFRNKETLFLALFELTLDELIKTVQPDINRENLAAAMVNTLLANPIYCKLSAILHTILERNLTGQEATDFKMNLLSLVGRYAQLIAEQTSLPLADTIALLMQVQQALIGCWHMSHPSGEVACAIEHGPLKIFKLDFGTALLNHVNRLVNSYD